MQNVWSTRFTKLLPCSYRSFICTWVCVAQLPVWNVQALLIPSRHVLGEGKLKKTAASGILSGLYPTLQPGASQCHPHFIYALSERKGIMKLQIWVFFWRASAGGAREKDQSQGRRDSQFCVEQPLPCVMRSHSLSGLGLSVLFFMFQLKSGHGAEGGGGHVPQQGGAARKFIFLILLR